MEKLLVALTMLVIMLSACDSGGGGGGVGSGADPSTSTSGGTNGSSKETEASGAGSNSAQDTVPPASPETSVPVVSLSGYPTGINRTGDLNIVVTGAATYRYKVGPASITDCAASVDYSSEKVISTPITDNITTHPDGLIRVCVVGKNSLGWQTFANATGYTWTKDFTAPNSPASVTVSSTSPTSVSVSWVGPTLAVGDFYIVVKKATTVSPWSLSSGVNYVNGQTDGSGSVVSYVGSGTSFVDSNLTTDVLYNYSVYTSDNLKNISIPQSGSGAPVRSWSGSNLVGEAGVLPLDTSGYQELPKAAADNNGNVIVAWLRSSSSRHVLVNTFTVAGGWGTPAALESGSQDAYVPRVVMNSSGQGAVLWAQNNSVKARRYSSGWASVETVGSYSTASYDLEAVIDNTGNITSVFPSGNNMVASRFSPGAGWSGNQVLNSHSGAPSNGRVAVDGNGAVMAVWMYGGQVYYSRFSASWAAAAVISLSALNIKNVKCDGTGNCMLVYLKSDGFVESLAAAKFSPSNGWSDLGLLESDTTNPVLVSISPLAVNANGNATVVWRQKYGCCNYGVFASHYTEASGWSSRTMIESVNHDTGVAPFVSGYGSDNAIAAWQGGSSSNTSDTGRSSRYISGQGWTSISSMGDYDFALPYFIADGLGNGIFFFIRVNIFDFKATRYYP